MITPACVPLASGGVESRLEPVDALALDGHYVKAAGGRLWQAHQVMARCEDDATALGGAHAGRGTAEAGAGALAHLGKDQGAVGFAQDQVDLAAAAPGGSIIALHEAQARAGQVRQGERLGRVPCLLRCRGPFCQEFHDRFVRLRPEGRP